MKPFALSARVHVSSIWLAIISFSFALFFQGVVQAAPIPAKEHTQTIKAMSSVIPPSLESIMGLDSEWNPKTPSPFIKKNDHYELKVDIQSANSVQFPLHLDAGSPILIKTRHGEVKQYLVSKAKYTAHLTGRYLVYVGEKNAVLYRYDTDTKSLREFVYTPNRDSISEKGEVIQWRFQGADMHLQSDGRVAIQKTVDIKNDIRKVSNNHMAERISRFLAKRYGKNGPQGPQTRTLFIIPRPVYLDDQGNKYGGNINYRLDQDVLTLQMLALNKVKFPLWADPTFTAADATIILDGRSDNARFGYSVASAGDFNGDGLDDVIVGAPYPHASSYGLAESGSAFIFFGKSVSSQLNLRAGVDADVILDHLNEGDRFGFSVSSAGDFNNDGFDDVIVGGDDNSNAFVFLGRPVTGQLTLISHIDADVILEGQTSYVVNGQSYPYLDWLGFSVASAGDVNGDGFSDIIVGAPFGSDINLSYTYGKAYVFFGRSLSSQLSLKANVDADIIVTGRINGSQFGYSVASAGDFNGDGLDDFIVGAAYEEHNNLSNSGSAFIFFGRSVASQLHLRADIDAAVILESQGERDVFGWSVASAGDFNGDGMDDVIVSNKAEINKPPKAFIFFGQSVTSQLTKADNDAAVILEPRYFSGSFGWSVASVGDFNNDGFDDVIVADPSDDYYGNSSGSAFIFFGRSVASQLTLRADTGSDIILDGQNYRAGFGSSVASAGDFNGDGFVDIIVGEYAKSTINSWGGGAYVFLSSDLGFTPPPADTTPPVITLNGNNPETVEVGDTYADAGATALDDVDGDLTGTITTIGLPINTSVPSVFTITYTVSDAAGNIASATRTVKVVDTTPPVITAPADITVNTDPGLPTAVVIFADATATDNSAIAPTVTQTSGPASNTPFPIGTTTVTWTATDASGNTATASMTVSVVDNEPPQITAPTSQTACNDPGQATAVVTFPDATATDNSEVAPTIVQTAGQASNSAFPLGTTTVSWTATDASGNTASDSMTITVNDCEPPVITAPANITANTDPGQPTAVMTFPDATATDNSGVVPTMTQTSSPTLGLFSGSAFPIGVTTVTWTATDAAGNTATASMTVTVVDNEAPVITAPADITVNTDPGLATAVVTFPSATATDNSGVAPTVTQIAGPVSGSAFPIGTTTVSWTATDASGNTASASMTVTVVDNEIEDTVTPDFNVTQTTDTLWPPNHKMVLAAVVSNITDNVDPDPNVSIVVTSNQPENGTGDGDTAPDWEVLRRSGGTWAVSLRAERSGNSGPRIYTVTISVSDASGNVRTQALTVTVPHDKRKRK